MPRFPFWFYLFVGLILIATGWASKWYVDQLEDAKADALLNAPPQAVQIEALDLRDLGAGNEVTIRAQLSEEITGQVANLDDENPRTGTYFGLFATTALDSKRAVTGILLSEDYIMDASYLESVTVEQGAFGRIVEINGAIGSADGVWRQLERDLEKLGRTFPRDTLTIIPFVEGREVALEPDPNRGNAIFALFALVGAIYIAYGFLRWYLRRREA